jgi:integrase
VINIYLSDVVPDQARPIKATERAERLLDFFGLKTLADINGPLCRAYVQWREGKGRSNMGTGGGAKRDLEDLRAAINHHAKEGLHRGLVRVPLPPRGKARQRWLTRSEAARLLWACWTAREHQKGIPTDKRPLHHLCRALLLGIYTGSRPGACLTASWERGEGRSWIDLDGARFHRLAEGSVETDKRQPPVKIAPRLLAHLKRWSRIDKGRGYVVRFGKSGGTEPLGSLKTAIARACDLAGLEGNVTAYALRHTAASWLVAKGLPTRQVAEFLGTSETMIDRYYAHHAPDFQDAAADAIGKK